MKLETIQVKPNEAQNIKELMYVIQRNFDRLQKFIDSGARASILGNLILVRTSVSYSLPSAMGTKIGYYIKNLSASTLTVSPAGSDTIDGASVFNMTFQYQSQLFIDGSKGNWDVF